MIKHLKSKSYVKFSTFTLFIIAAGLVGATCFAFDGNGRNVKNDSGVIRQNHNPNGNIKTKSFESDGGINPSDTYSFNPCDLEVVGGDGCGGKSGVLGATRGGVLLATKEYLKYDITSYATDPNHEKAIASILASMPQIKDKFDADAYIRAHRPKSPITGGMVERAAKKFGGDMRLILAIIQQDSSFGTEGLGARTNNPGNVANNDSGNVFSYPSWEAGVNGVAKWLSNHKI